MTELCIICGHQQHPIETVEQLVYRNNSTRWCVRWLTLFCWQVIWAGTGEQGEFLGHSFDYQFSYMWGNTVVIVQSVSILQKGISPVVLWFDL